MSTELAPQREQNNNNRLNLSDQHIMRALLFGMALSIIAFNVMGYKELFNESGVFFGITPFGLLIGFAEVAVLFWTSSVIRNLPTASRALIYAVIPVVLGFWFLCFTGINSYLKNSTYDDFTQTQAARSRYENNENLLTSIDAQIATLQSSLTAARGERTLDNDRITQLQIEANKISEKMSQRRLGYALCDKNPDCAAAVADFQQQTDNIQRQMDLLHMSMVDKQRLISGYEAELTALNREKRELAKENRDSINQYAQTESSFSVKKQTYENIVIRVYQLFGLERPVDPFSIFIGFISFIIYPVYLILNLYTGLGSEANCAAREVRKTARLEKNRHKAAIQTEIQEQKELIAREKRTLAHQKTLEQIKSGQTKRSKLLNYLHARIHQNDQLPPQPHTAHALKREEAVKEIVVKTEPEMITEKPLEAPVEKAEPKEVEPIASDQMTAPVEQKAPTTTGRVKTLLSRFSPLNRR